LSWNDCSEERGIDVISCFLLGVFGLVLKGRNAIIVLKILGVTAENFSSGLPGARDLRTAVCSPLNLSGYYTNQQSKNPTFCSQIVLNACGIIPTTKCTNFTDRIL
jgi:hypothetical protein